jgi:hypothetical protein
MTNDPRNSPKMRGVPCDYRPSIFKSLGLSGSEIPHTLCAHCPAAMWYERDGLVCFCTVMKVTTWTPAGEPVSACDGRDAAVAEYEQQMSKLVG